MIAKFRVSVACCSLFSFLCAATASAQSPSQDAAARAAPAAPTAPSTPTAPAPAEPPASAPTVAPPSTPDQAPSPTEAPAASPAAQAVTTASPPPPAPQISTEQLSAFADLTDDSKTAVSSRLSTDPKLLPLAIAAADVRLRRKRTGKTLTIVGFAVLGVGDIAGTIIMMSTPGYPTNIKKENVGQVILGAAIDVVGLGAGLAMAIPGLLKMARETEVEAQAREYYSPPEPEVGEQEKRAQLQGTALTLPILGATF